MNSILLLALLAIVCAIVLAVFLALRPRAPINPWHGLALALVMGPCADPAYAQAVPPRCDTATCTFQWTPAPGPVQGYEVWVKRGAAPFAKEIDVPITSAALVNAKSETVVVRVRAYATDVTPRRSGPDSVESDPVTFLAPLGVPGKPGLAAP